MDYISNKLRCWRSTTITTRSSARVETSPSRVETSPSLSASKISWAHAFTLLSSSYTSIFNILLVSASITALFLRFHFDDDDYHHYLYRRLNVVAAAEWSPSIALNGHSTRLISSLPPMKNTNLVILLRRLHGGRGGYKELIDGGYGNDADEEEEELVRKRAAGRDDDDDEEAQMQKQLKELEGVMNYKDADAAEKARIAEVEHAIRETDDADQREALLHELHELKNAGVEYRQQKTYRRERSATSQRQTNAEIRKSSGVLPSHDPFSKMFQQHDEQAARDDEVIDEDAQTEGLTDIEADPSQIRREWNVPDEPLPPPDQPPSDEEDVVGTNPTTALEKLQEEMEKEEEEEFEKSTPNYAGPLSFRPLPKQQPYEAPDFAAILNAPEYVGKRRRGGKQVRMKEFHTRKSQRFHEKNRARSDARKVQKILQNKYGRSS